MAASCWQEIVTEVADSLGYCLKAKQKKPYLPLLMGNYSSLCLLAMGNSCVSHHKSIAQEYVHSYAHIMQ